jgi:hypothetical protein
MDSDDWPECIVTFMDLIDTTKYAKSGEASRIMQNMHESVISYVETSGNWVNHEHTYVWNDSVLLLAYLDKPGRHLTRKEMKETILREADAFKRHIDADLGRKTFAIAVQGQTFPHYPYVPSGARRGKQISDQPDVVVLKASSWAFANCFEIDRLLSKHKKSWYVDERITKSIATGRKPTIEEAIQMWPKQELRAVYMYDDYLW